MTKADYDFLCVEEGTMDPKNVKTISELARSLERETAELNKNLDKLEATYSFGRLCILILQLCISITVLLIAFFLTFQSYLNLDDISQIPPFADDIAVFILTVSVFWTYRSYFALKAFVGGRRQAGEILLNGKMLIKKNMCLLNKEIDRWA